MLVRLINCLVNFDLTVLYTLHAVSISRSCLAEDQSGKLEGRCMRRDVVSGYNGTSKPGERHVRLTVHRMMQTVQCLLQYTPAGSKQLENRNCKSPLTKIKLENERVCVDLGINRQPRPRPNYFPTFASFGIPAILPRTTRTRYSDGQFA